jgi:hypothetical protein
VIEDLIEPEWPAEHERSWGQWSKLRGELIPGTAIFLTRKPRHLDVLPRTIRRH